MSVPWTVYTAAAVLPLALQTSPNPVMHHFLWSEPARRRAVCQDSASHCCLLAAFSSFRLSGGNVTVPFAQICQRPIRHMYVESVLGVDEVRYLVRMRRII